MKTVMVCIIHENWMRRLIALNENRLTTITNAHVRTNSKITFAGIPLHKCPYSVHTDKTTQHRPYKHMHRNRNGHDWNYVYTVHGTFWMSVVNGVSMYALHIFGGLFDGMPMRLQFFLWVCEWLSVTKNAITTTVAAQSLELYFKIYVRAHAALMYI